MINEEYPIDRFPPCPIFQFQYHQEYLMSLDTPVLATSLNSIMVSQIFTYIFRLMVY